MAKMTVLFERCKGCELCTSVCPKHIVALQKEKRNKREKRIMNDREWDWR